MGMSRLIFPSLRYPIVQAPMAGGPSTPALAAAVSGAGGLGFLAAGYKTVDQVERELAEVRSVVPAGVPYGINVFAPPGHGMGAAEVSSYADRLRNEAQERGHGAALRLLSWRVLDSAVRACGRRDLHQSRRRRG